MKQEFSTSWQASKQPRKQRKFVANAPLHIKHRFLSASLSKDLRKKHGKRNIPLKKGDEVLIMRGKSAKKKAKVISIDLKKTRVVLENINQTKKDGTKVPIYFHPSNLQIQTLSSEDKKRLKALNRKSSEKKTEKKEEKNVSN